MNSESADEMDDFILGQSWMSLNRVNPSVKFPALISIYLIYV